MPRQEFQRASDVMDAGGQYYPDVRLEGRRDQEARWTSGIGAAACKRESARKG